MKTDSGLAWEGLGVDSGLGGATRPERSLRRNSRAENPRAKIIPAAGTNNPPLIYKRARRQSSQK